VFINVFLGLLWVLNCGYVYVWDFQCVGVCAVCVSM